LETLEPAGGKLYAHVFENRSTGMRRGLYWALSIDLEPLVNAGESWDCNIQCEWFTWNIKRWTELDGLGLSDLLLSELAESSLYLAEHQPTTLVEALRIRRRAGSKFDVSLTVVGDIQLPDGQDRFATGISQTALVDFDGVYVVTDNLFPKPDTADEAAGVVDQFLRSDDFEPPMRDRFRYVLSPHPSAR